MKNIVIILLLLSVCFFVKAQQINPEQFKLNIEWNDSVSKHSYKNCILHSFNDNSLTIYRYNPEINLSVNYDIIKLNFGDLESLQIQKRRHILANTLACAAGGALIGGIIGGAIGESKCSGGSSYLGLGMFCGAEEFVGGVCIGGLIGGLTGICIAGFKVNIPLEKDKTNDRKMKLIRMQY